MDVPTPGTVIAERYRLTRPLGSGSSAVVWEAQDSSLDRLVAVKLLHGGAAAHPAGREQLRREALALARLSHPRVTTVFDYIEWQDGDGDFQPVLVTELLAGLNLEDRLEQGPLLENDARLACAQLASALEAVHQVGIIHRDLKPGNVMLMSDGVKLLDFGIAQASSDTDARTGLVVGTPACMAPEQLTGRGALPASDVYALGCILYWCVTGRAPFEGATVDDVVKGHLHRQPPPLPTAGLPPQIAGIYRQCLAKDPLERPAAATVAAVLELRGAPAEIPGAARPPANRTMVMQPYEAPTRPSYLAAQEQPAYMGPRVPPQSVPDDDDGGSYPAQPTFPGPPPPRRYNWIWMVLGALVIAFIAAAGTALFMKGSQAEKQTTSAPPPGITATTGPGGSATGPSGSSPSGTPSTTATSSGPASTLPPTADPGKDPVAFLEGVRGQVDGYIAQGAATMDPNAGRDLQNSLTDLESAVQVAQQHNMKGHYLRDAQNKADQVVSRINDDQTQGLTTDPVASVLSGEVQNLSDALGNSGNN
ncbi:serine/threonine-protein kinase [Catenulispora rubra]|uniref:serine/threonine-protein kinase n=1 Tax=Catenulispora rubra TaxID=280293 RepID=UPI00189249C8|nr:serine/threonine-protein kinase [Catenulispora rubra]